MQRGPYKMDLDRQFKSDFMHQHMLKISFQLVKHWPLDWQLIIKKNVATLGLYNLQVNVILVGLKILRLWASKCGSHCGYKLNLFHELK